MCFVLGLCHNTDIVRRWMSPLLPYSSNMHSYRSAGPTSSPIARTPLMMIPAGEDMLAFMLWLASQVCLGLVNQQGHLFCMACILKASEVKRWCSGRWFLGPLAELDRGCISQTLLMPEDSGGQLLRLVP